MASGPITSWQIDGETMETLTDFIFLSSEITADSDCSLETKRHLLLGRKAMTNWDSVLKSRDITLLTKIHPVKAMVFPVVMYGCELDHQEGWALRNWWFWIVVLEKTLESPLDDKEIRSVNPKGNQPWIFIGRTDAEAEAPILWPLDAKSRLEKTLMMGKIEGKSRRRMRWLDGIINLMDMNLIKFWEIVKDRETWCATVQGIAKHLTWPSNWTEEAQVPAKKAFGDISSRDDG